MAVETLGEAWKLGWRVRAHCYWLGPNKSGKRMVPWCDTTVELDMVTLVWTRGENFPLKLLPERLRCPKCGLMKVRVWFNVPNQPNSKAVAAERRGLLKKRSRSHKPWEDSAMRFAFATAAAVLTVGIVAALTVSPGLAQKKNSAAAVQKKKAADKMSHNRCVELAYQRGFADSDIGGAGSFIYWCKRGKQR